MRIGWVLLAFVLAAGCSGKTTSSGGSGGNAGSGGAAPACPASPPANGSACDIAPGDAGVLAPRIADCTWGDDPRTQCRTTALCTNGHWALNPASFCPPPLPPACPSPEPASGTTCADSTLGCWYDDGTRCTCSACKGGSEYPVCQTIDPPQWACTPPVSGCPKLMPQAGTPCSTPGVDCSPDCDLQIVCEGGVWKWNQGQCPICASPDTPIATPAGERPIAALRVGDLVYSEDHGAIVAVPIARVASTRVAHHHVIRVVLASGRVLEVSAGHPTADGRSFGDLRAGGVLDGQRVIDAEVEPYTHERTYDILPASSTGTYFAAGAEIGSTLFRTSATR